MLGMLLAAAFAFASCDKLQDLFFFEELPEGALPGEFSISADKKVHFSQGNLVFDATDGYTDAYFFEHQYDCPKNGPVDPNIRTEFYWGYSWGSWKPEPEYRYYYEMTDPFKDWGSVMGSYGGKDGWGDYWRTLSKDEWMYLFDNHEHKYTEVRGQYGYAIAPDGFDGIIADEYVTAADWEKAEKAGLVFLPMTGDNINDEIKYCGELGSYWTSTALEGEEGAEYAYILGLDYVHAGIYDRHKTWKCAVRLVTESK